MPSAGENLRTQNVRSGALLLLLLAGTAAVYSNHFRNSFHFDDFHTVTDNLAIRSLGNVPRFFTDPSAFSNLPTHQVYRPLVTTSLAIDYRIAGGLHPWAFHATTFFWYLVQLVVMFALFRELTEGSERISLFATALYALHPVAAETVNYVIQRGDLYSTLGTCAALLVFIRKPQWRKYGVYMIPFVAALLAKPPALVFPMLLLVYLRLYEPGKMRQAMPAWAVAIAGGTLLSRMVASTFSPGGGDRAAYWITQTWVTLEYFLAFFWPSHLSADTDAQLIRGFPAEAWAGILFVMGLGTLSLWLSRRTAWRPAGFGLAWFLITLAPTALMPLAEVANDHRMYFPFVGLTLAVSWTAARLIHGRAAVVAACLILTVAGYAAHLRNEVWLSEETLWRDVTVKSPNNGRGWMNYGLTLMARSDYGQALACLERAQQLTPDYSLLEINLGIVKGALGRPADAESHFQRALTLAPNHPASHHYYGRWLLEQRRYADAVPRLERAVQLSPGDQAARALLMKAHFDQQNWSALRSLVSEALRLDAADTVAADYQKRIAALDQQIAVAEKAAAGPEALVELSLLYYRAGRFADCVRAAGDAVRLRPGYAAAYNNLTAGYNAMQRWDDAIAAGREAVRLDPSSQLAHNNLAWALASKQIKR
jgi:tetratricopeptide (TPR) repeat protein